MVLASKVINTMSNGSQTSSNEHFKGFFTDILKKNKPIVKEVTKDIKNGFGLQKISAESTNDLMVALKMNAQDIRRSKRVFSQLGINILPSYSSINEFRKEKLKRFNSAIGHANFL